MRIGELAALTGVDVETVRYYEREALLSEPARDANGYRRYAAEHVERLSFIRHCRSLDVGLHDVKRLLALIDAPSANCKDADELVEQQLTRVHARIVSLQALERQLRSVRGRCKSPRRAGKCGILAELKHAARCEACSCHRTHAIKRNRTVAGS
jgi:Cd(II)/Pb(II)-responsive transcriptional regulator